MVKISLTTQDNGKPFPAEPLALTCDLKSKYACKLSNVKLARILLEHGIDVNGYQSPYDTYKVYPIMEAIANNNIELVKLLLEYHVRGIKRNAIN